MEEHLIEIMDQGRLAAVLHLPDNYKERPCPLVIYCPGKNGERYEVHRLAVKFARRLAAQGIAFLRFDYYGMGLSDGKYYEMTTSTKVSNVKAALSLAQKLPFIRSNEIFYLGFSDGARIALMAAKETKVHNVLFWSPLFYEFGGDYPNGKHPRFFRHFENVNYLVMPWAGLWVGMNFYRDLLEIDIEDYLSSFKGSSLLIYGDEDPLIQEEFVKLDTSKYAIYKNQYPSKVVCIPGAGHLFTSFPLEQQLMELTEQWIWKKLEESGNHVASD
ncbi:alpha/beta hydrolase [Fictibacillus enclensis]|uniref:alpha/beta hydrolase n=1 Tax=Fictibacillus enclensis TaxID=1017270 RepID=UPI0025A0939F|nr:alpha/beta fold hydrolase [Fictibacillus enclensis]MDM5335851.1 alpha/beta hydrolase [Fictibacillus enclensis]